MTLARCNNFGTCTGTGGISQVNHELFEAGGLFPQGRDLLHEGKCSEVRAVVDQIVSLMTVPLVQGTLRYAYKVPEPLTLTLALTLTPDPGPNPNP